MIKCWFCHQDPFEYEYRCTEYEYEYKYECECLDELATILLADW